MTRREFENLRNLPDKKIFSDISFSEPEATSPVLIFENIQVDNSLSLDIRLNGKYNPIVDSLVFNFRVRGVGPICRLEINSTMHSGSRTHKHALVHEDDPRRNLPTNVTPRPELQGKLPAVIWRILCREARINHVGNFFDPTKGGRT